MSAADADLAAVLEEVFADLSGSATDPSATGTLWGRVDRLGFTGVGIPEADGGSGGTLADALAVQAAAVRHRVGLPLAETFLGRVLLGGVAPSGPLSLALPHPADDLTVEGDRVRGAVHRVPWGQAVSAAAAWDARDPGSLLLLDADASDVVPVAGISPSPLASWRPHPEHTVQRVEARTTRDDLFWLGALCRCAQMTAAMRAVCDLTLRYTGEREQFGRPVGRFQAVQQHLVTVAQCATLCEVALDDATRAWSQERPGATFAVATAKLLADECAAQVCRAAHQAHGAIGMTLEYPLQWYVRHLQSWRHQLGTEDGLAEAIGDAVAGTRHLSRVVTGGAGPSPEVVATWS